MWGNGVVSTFSSNTVLGTKIHASDSSVVVQIAWAQPFIEYSFNVIVITFIYAMS